MTYKHQIKHHLETYGVFSAATIMIILCVFFIALGSIFANILLLEIPAHQVLWLRMFGYLIVMAPITLALHFKVTVRPQKLGNQLLRGLFGSMVALLLLFSIRDIGVSQAIAAFYVYPAITYLAGVTWLGEPSSKVKWAAVGLGFGGAMIALQPGFHGSSPESAELGIAYALGAAVLASARIALHRRDRNVSPPMTSALWDRGIGAILATAIIIFIWTPIESSAYGAVLGLVLSSIIAQLLLVYAISKASLGALAPFTYWEVVFVIMLDFAVLGTPISNNMAIGGLFIITAGVVLGSQRRKPS